ncbi:XrtA-associated tyrosine autokinase [Candidatus Accumulibacter cognatus]|uniref:non-specific protein-tyrosine kinase n=1 Tax=Candidatus Accumulibacter cognatus TaxID=2954383 RepID=A0A080MAJ0_9PROT|nr:XrtA-associated tyrosine autokinase [Candidatus Accumulibacter cognatus]KFB78001.1 MAG: Tyrosine-protein kinase YwqD [Candidatus Accumulibacter cognatus]
MSLIEQAAKRLEQLRKAGVEIPGSIAEHERLPADLRAAVPAQPQTVQVQPPDVLSATTASASAAHTPQSRRIELDLNTLATTGLISPDAPRSQLADQYRVIKRPLIANAMGKSATPIKRGNLIMVTSAISGEGKTFTAINLAMSIAMELDNTVMLVDADVPKPSVLKMLGLPPAPGLLDVLTDESVALSHVLMRTNVDKLSLLPSGTQHQRATELLASEAMIKLLDEMANRYPDRIIIFDSPPLLMTTESRVLASHMGQVIVVVRAERTARSDVKHALAAIESCPVKLMLLNQARATTQDGYGYGYGSDGS